MQKHLLYLDYEISGEEDCMGQAGKASLWGQIDVSSNLICKANSIITEMKYS